MLPRPASVSHSPLSCYSPANRPTATRVKRPAAKSSTAKRVKKPAVKKRIKKAAAKKPSKKPIAKKRGSNKFATNQCSSEDEYIAIDHFSGGTKAVMNMVDYLDGGKNYKISFDNWFSSVSLAYRLLAKGMHSTATIQIRRVKGNYMNIKYLKAE